MDDELFEEYLLPVCGMLLPPLRDLWLNFKDFFIDCEVEDDEEL